MKRPSNESNRLVGGRRWQNGRSGEKKPPNKSNDSLGVAKRGRDEVGGWRDEERGWRYQDMRKRPPNKSNRLIGGCRMQEGRKNTQ